MTALRDGDGRLVVYSPVQGAADWGAALEAHGEVGAIVAPNAFHHLFALDACARFPQARLVASAGLRAKRPDFPSSTTWLEGDAPVELGKGVVAHPVRGMPGCQEWVLLHEPSGTLVVADLVFHLLEPGFVLGLVTRLFGTYQRLAVSRLFVRARVDRDAFAASLAAIEKLAFDRLVVAHGTPILEGARVRVAEAFARSP
jgi:hypothetical protein